MKEEPDTTQPDVDGGETAPTRRTVMKAGLVGAAAIALSGTGLATANAQTRATLAAGGRLELTPTCTDGDDTPSNIEGPFFKRNSPLRTNLVTGGVTGVLLSLAGTVFDEHCKPASGALLEFWQADKNGEYDNTTYTLRGHQYSTASGAYTLETIVPKDYPGRTTHIHVKVQAPNGPVFTSQLFFPDTMQAYGMNVAVLNRRDRFINRKCTVTLGTLSNNRYPGTFNFVIKTA